MFITQIANKLKSKKRYRLIQQNGKKYLERFYVFSSSWLGIYLHRFWSDDDDRGLHDHPWTSISVLLAGEYFEEMSERQNSPNFIKRRRPLRPLFYFRKATDAHRISLPEGKEGQVWSLFIRFKRKRKWGFYINGTWEAAKIQSRRDDMLPTFSE